MSNKSIIKELDLKDYTFNLKSQSTGKYSVHDSYRDNYTNGFLVNVNAPEDVNNALKDIYYATEKGMVISYRDFNNRIVSVRKSLLMKNFPDKEIKDLAKDERLKIEMESAKQVLRDLAINESTKLIYSPELTEAKMDADSQDLRIKYLPDEFKVIFHESDDKEKERLVKAYLEFSEQVKPILENAVSSYNLDEIELTLLSIERLFNDLPDFARENNDIEDFYNQSKSQLNESAQLMRERQIQLEEKLTEKVNEIINKQDFKKIKSTISEIETDFTQNFFISNDPKSNSIKELAITHLKNTGKVIALASLKDWDESNFSMAKNLINYGLNLELENLLNKKYAFENEKRRVEEEKLTQVDFESSEDIYQKFMSLISQKDLFVKLFDIIAKDNFDKLNTILLENENSFGFIVMLSNNLPVEKAEKLWNNFSNELISNLSSRIFPYHSINSNGIRNIYFELLSEKATNEILDNVFSNIKINLLRNIDSLVLSKNLLRLSQFDFSLEIVLRKLVPEKLLNLLKSEVMKSNDFVKNTIIVTLIKWLPNLSVDSPEFSYILLNHPEMAVYNLKNNQVENLDTKIIQEILEKLDNKKEALHYFMLRIGRQKFDEAIKSKLKNLTEKEPDNFEHHYNLGLSYFKEKSFEDAILEFKKSVGINPESHIAHYTLGYLYDQIGRYDLAIPEYKKAIQLKYGYIEAYYNLGLIYNRMKDYFLGSQQFKKILKIEPENYNAIVNLGVAYEEMGEYDQAKQEYKKAIEVNPEKSEAYMNLAILYSSKGLIDEAIEMYIKALDYESENANLHYNLGLLYHQQKNLPLATAHYKTSIKYDNTKSQVFNNLGLVYFVRVKVPKAIEMWKKAIELDNNIDAYNNLGWAYCIEGDFEKSIETYEEAKKIDPQNAQLYLNLGTVYYRITENKKAVEQLEKYLELEEISDKKFEVMKIIRNIKNINSN